MKKIPKIVHYIWVGKKPLTSLARNCIASWKKFLPEGEWEYRFWTEQNLPSEVTQHHYFKEMYRKGKWAFVADYVRFWALEREGGIYLDTDTEVLKSFDTLLDSGVFFGKTKDGFIAAGVIGAVSNHQSIKDILNIYEKDKKYDTSRTSPLIVTEVLESRHYDDVKIYDYSYFNPCDDGEKCTPEKLAYAYTNNHWAESWVPCAKLRKILRRVGILPLIKNV